jgi:hypothetical protein
MSDGGKGDKPRPLSVSQEEFDNRWDNIFRKEKTKEEFDVEDPDPAKRSWFYDNHGVKRKKEEVKIKATIPDVKIKGSVN